MITFSINYLANIIIIIYIAKRSQKNDPVVDINI